MSTTKTLIVQQLKNDEVRIATWESVGTRYKPGSVTITGFIRRLQTPDACFNTRGIDAGLTIDIVRKYDACRDEDVIIDGRVLTVTVVDKKTKAKTERPAKYDDLKRNFVHAYAFQFKDGHKTKLENLQASDSNPLIIFDADHLSESGMTTEDAKKALFAHPACVFAATSLGGNGVFACYRIDEAVWPKCIELGKASHQRADLIEALLRTITASTGIDYDPQCKDQTRCRAASYDAAPLIRDFASCEAIPMPDAAQIARVSEREIKRAPGRPRKYPELATDTPKRWRERMKALAGCPMGGRKSARFGAMVEAWRLHLTMGLDLALLEGEIRAACEANKLHDDAAALSSWDENWQQAQARVEAECSDVLSFEQLQDVLSRHGGAERIKDNVRVSCTTFEAWDALRAAFMRDYYPVASDKPAGAVALTPDHSAREMKAGQWQTLLKRRIYCLKEGKFASFEQASHESAFCQIRPTVDYSRPAGELKELPGRDDLRTFEINRAHEVPPIEAAYDSDAWRRALMLLGWIAHRFERPNEAQWYLSYIAQALCNVKRKPCTAIDLLCTTGGGAKSVLAMGVTQFIWGYDGAVQNVDSETRPGMPFNGSLSEALFIVDDEAPIYKGPMVEAYNEQVTDPTFKVKRKYMDVAVINSQHRFIRTSNHERIGYNGGTERRCAVFRIPAPETPLAYDTVFLDYIAPYIGLIDPKDPARRPSDYEQVRGAFIDLLRRFYNSELYFDVTKPPPASTLKDASKFLAILSDKTATRIAQWMIARKNAEGAFKRRSAIELAREVTGASFGLVELSPTEVRNACKAYPKVFNYDTNGWRLLDDAYRALTDDALDTCAPPDEWRALDEWRPQYAGDALEDIEPPLEFDEKSAGIQADAPIKAGAYDLYESSLKPTIYDDNLKQTRAYLRADLEADAPLLATARRAWRGLECPPIDLIHGPADAVGAWMIDASSCPAFPPFFTRLTGGMALAIPQVWGSAPDADRAQYVAQWAHQLAGAYERVKRWRDADIMTRLYHSMMQTCSIQRRAR